jgi:hypothetical protein
MLSIEERLDFYIGDFDYSKQKNPHEEIGDSNQIFDYPFKALKSGFKSRLTYDVDIYRYLNYCKGEGLWFICGDIMPSVTYPTLVKIRDTFNSKSIGIIANLNSSRHWNFNVNNDIEWEAKKSDFIWRGADTGKNMSDNPRHNFVFNFYQNYNVGYNMKLQNFYIYPYMYKDEMYKGNIQPNELLEFKYLPILEGNDKSSALNWTLASNSVPIMSKPRFYSWLCEKYLIPNFHYVECKRDFSDFLEKIEWCKSHDKEAKQISQNGKRFMENFWDKEKESIIEKKIVEFVENL